MVIGQCSSYLNFSVFKKQPLLLSLSKNPTTRRPNYLRKKLLKTLTKPVPNLIITPLETPPRLRTLEQNNEVFIAQENAVSVNDVIKAEFGKHWVFKLGFCLVAIFVFQTVCAIWVFGSVREEGKDSVFEGKSSERSNLLLGEDSVSGEKSSVLLSGNDDLGTINMEERLSEIQAMARKVRDSEKVKSKANEGDDDGVFRTEIDREVDMRLMKIQKKLESFVKMPALRVGEKEESKGIDKIEPLMIKKKYKFKGSSGDLGDKPKGFTGMKDSRVNKSTNVLDSLDQLSGDSSVSVIPPLESKGIQTPEKKLGNARMQNESRMGATQEASLKNPVGNNNITSNVENEHLKGKAGQWWHSLPYVVAVMMGRGRDSEGPMGLFTLQTSPYANDESDLSHIVAFEDRGDATNFSYILESFFEDLGDFSANIVPLSVKELKEEVKSHSKKVLVVKKRQLKLYAGQPFAEVEMALRSLVE